MTVVYATFLKACQVLETANNLPLDQILQTSEEPLTDWEKNILVNCLPTAFNDLKNELKLDWTRIAQQRKKAEKRVI